MVDTLWADISEFQVGVDDGYSLRFLSFRSNDGTYRDHKFAHNLTWSKRKCDSGQLAGFLVYFVFEPNWQQTIAVVKAMIGTPHKRMAIMIDVESWGGRLHGDMSNQINAAREDLITWLGSHMSLAARLLKKHRKRVVGYGNAYDLARLWPHRGDARIVLANYSANPGFPGKLAHQFSDKYAVKPFGHCDINSADGMTPTQLAKALGLDPDPAPPAHAAKPKPPVRHVAAKPKPKPQPAVYYKVRSGDTLGQIAARYHTKWPALQKLNHLPNPNRIYVGQRLRVR